jgi:hypothetical protein
MDTYSTVALSGPRAVREPDAHALKEPVVNGIGVGRC